MRSAGSPQLVEYSRFAEMGGGDRWDTESSGRLTRPPGRGKVAGDWNVPAGSADGVLALAIEPVARSSRGPYALNGPLTHGIAVRAGLQDLRRHRRPYRSQSARAGRLLSRRARAFRLRQNH